MGTEKNNKTIEAFENRREVEIIPAKAEKFKRRKLLHITNDAFF